MIRTMISLAKMQFKQYNIYKSNFYLFTLNKMVDVVVYIFVWQAIYNQTGNARRFYNITDSNLLYFSNIF